MTVFALIEIRFQRCLPNEPGQDLGRIEAIAEEFDTMPAETR